MGFEGYKPKLQAASKKERAEKFPLYFWWLGFLNDRDLAKEIKKREKEDS